MSRAPSPNNLFGDSPEDGAVGPVAATPGSCSNSTYCDMAAKTVENIRKLQENVSGGSGNGGNEKTTIWVGNYQVTSTTRWIHGKNCHFFDLTVLPRRAQLFDIICFIEQRVGSRFHMAATTPCIKLVTSGASNALW